MEDPLMEIVNALQNIPVIAYIIGIGLIIIAIANFTSAISDIYSFWKKIYEHASGLRMSKSELRKQTMEVVRKLNNLIADRQPYESKALYSRKLTVENFQEVSRDAIEYAQTTKNLYIRDLAADMDELRFQYKKRGITNVTLENHQNYTINTIGLQSISKALSEVAAKL